MGIQRNGPSKLYITCMAAKACDIDIVCPVTKKIVNVLNIIIGESIQFNTISNHCTINLHRIFEVSLILVNLTFLSKNLVHELSLIILTLLIDSVVVFILSSFLAKTFAWILPFHIERLYNNQFKILSMDFIG
jgi:hypothetical protein